MFSVYWKALKACVKSDDGFQLSTICRQLKLEAFDGKKYETDCANKIRGRFGFLKE